MLINPLMWEKFSELKLGILLVKQINNTENATAVYQHLRTIQHNTRNKFAQTDLANIPKLCDWREAYRTFGAKPSTYKCSVESLLRRTMQGKELPDINPLVNLYNAVSLKHLVCAGADDQDRLRGTLQLTWAEGNEHFAPIGSVEKLPPNLGEIIYRDDEGVTCRMWNWRECDRTKITQETTSAILVLEGLQNTSMAEIAQALQELLALIKRFCGGSATGYLLDASMPDIGEETLLGTRSVPIEIPTPDYHKHEAYQTRVAKIHALREDGIDPYPHKFEKLESVADVIARSSAAECGSFEQAAHSKTSAATIAGRMVLFRPMGTNAFAHILDGSAKLQVVFNRDHVQVPHLSSDLTAMKWIEKRLDLGDIIGCKGHLFKTQKGELTLFVKELTLLCKTALPLPDKHKGLSDKGTRYRKRWLDLIVHPEVGEHFHMRSKLVSGIRKYFEAHGFLEVETPILQNIYGGAAAKPFTTHHNALSQDMYLRIALEIALKKLVVGGMHRVFEIGKVFRNEGIDRTHNPEFTMLESYAAYWDYHDVMAFTENLYATLAKDLLGTTELGKRNGPDGQEHVIDVKTPWIRMTMKEAIKTYGKLDVDAMDSTQMKKQLEGHVEPDKLTTAKKGHLISMLFEVFSEHHLIQPHHIIDHPIETTPLCKLHRNPKEREQQIVERFESFILGVECCNAYTELNDPLLQRGLLEEQAKQRESGDDEASPMDEEFIEAICQGMPPSGGLGIGIDRLCMLFTGVSSIRDILFFPVMRPEE